MTGNVAPGLVEARVVVRSRVAIVAGQSLSRGHVTASGATLFAIWLLAASVATPSMAATYTWIGTGDGQWSNGANWTPNFGAAPTPPLDLVFDGSGGVGTNDLPSGTEIRSMSYTTTAGSYGFVSSDPGDVTANTMNIAPGGLVSVASPNDQEVNFRLNLVNPLEVNVTGAGRFFMGNASGASNLNKTGNGTLVLSAFFPTDGFTGLIGDVIVLEGKVVLEAGSTLPNTAFITAPGTTLSGGLTIAKQIIAAGVVETGYVDSGNRIDSLATGNLKLLPTSTTLFDINAAQTSLPPNLSNTSVLLTAASGSAALEYGGQVEVEFANSNTYAIGTSWDLFAASAGTSVDRTGVLSGFSTKGVGSPYDNLQFVKISAGTGSGDAIWQSDWAGSTDTKLVFNEATGQLVVVPEPPTMVFAGIGAAMTGWSFLRRRHRRHGDVRTAVVPMKA